MAAIGSQYVATGATAAFTTGTGLLTTCDVVSVAWDGAFAFETIETTNLATTTARTYKPGNLYDGGTITLEIHLDADFAAGSPPWPFSTPTAAVDTLTITLPSSTTTSTWAASVILTGVSFNAATEQLITATVTCKVTGAITITT